MTKKKKRSNKQRGQWLYETGVGFAAAADEEKTDEEEDEDEDIVGEVVFF
jgi:hypothetical protein